jgi:UDP-glucose 4-epimerase
MKALVVISVDIPNPDAILDVIRHLDPPNIVHFDGTVRVVVGESVAETVEFLDEGY